MADARNLELGALALSIRLGVTDLQAASSLFSHVGIRTQAYKLAMLLVPKAASSSQELN